MIRECAWCNKNMGEIAPIEDKRITHGICPECLKSQLEEARKERDDELPNGS